MILWINKLGISNVHPHSTTYDFVDLMLILDVKTVRFYISFQGMENEIFNICKISFNKRYLLHTYMLLYPYCYHTKKERTDPGTSLDRVDFKLDRKRGK